MQTKCLMRLPQIWSVELVFKGTVVNHALISLHGGSFEITLTVPLSQFKKNERESGEGNV